MLNDNERMVRCAMFDQKEDALLRDIGAIGNPSDSIKALLESGLLFTDAAAQVRAYLRSIPEYRMVRLCIWPTRAQTYPHSRMPDGGTLPGDDRQWTLDGNLFHFSTTIGGQRKDQQALYLWLCLAAPSTPED